MVVFLTATVVFAIVGLINYAVYQNAENSWSNAFLYLLMARVILPIAATIIIIGVAIWDHDRHIP
jgi:hypothetical protein